MFQLYGLNVTIMHQSKQYRLFVVPTGGPVPFADYIGTIFIDSFVWHLYIDKELALDVSRKYLPKKDTI